MDSITSENFISYVLDKVPEFSPVYANLAEREPEKSRGIDRPPRVLYYLGYFAVHAVAKNEEPELEGPIFDDLDDLLARLMEVIENAVQSSDPEIVNGVKAEFLRVLYLMESRQEKIMRHAGPNLLALGGYSYETD